MNKLIIATFISFIAASTACFDAEQQRYLQQRKLADVEVLFPLEIQNTLQAAIEDVIESVARLDSVQSLTKKNIEEASRASAELIKELSAVNDAAGPLGRVRVSNAISAVIGFINDNELIPGKKLVKSEEGVVVTGGDASTNEVTRIEQFDISEATEAIVGKVAELATNLGTIDGLIILMEVAVKYQESVQVIGDSLLKFSEGFKEEIDFDLLNNFRFKLF